MKIYPSYDRLNSDEKAPSMVMRWIKEVWFWITKKYKLMS